MSSGSMPKAVNVGLAVVAITVGVALGVWPSDEPAPPAQPPVAAVTTTTKRTAPATSAAEQTPAAAPVPQTSETPAAPTKPAVVAPAAPPLPAAPNGVAVTVLQESANTLRVTVKWNVGSGNGRPVTGHRVNLRTDRGDSATWETGADGDGGTRDIACGAKVCDGIKLDAEVRAVTSAGTGATGRGGVTYSAPYTVPREQRSNVGAPNPSQAQANATQTLPGLRAAILTAGIDCTNWQEQVVHVYTAPNSSYWVFAGIVTATCKY